MVAEVVRTVTATNPDAAQGNRVVAQLRRASIEVAEAHFNARGIKHTRHDDRLRVVFAGEDDETETVVWIVMAGRRKDTFILTGFGVGIDFPQEERERVCAFAADWNQRTWNPKAVVMVDEDTERCKVIGEIAVSIGPWITRAQVDVALGRGVATLFGLFADVRQLLIASEPDAQMASIDVGESVIEA
ncbi:YbjN domain-containing protein [Mycolicibacterium vanbaalenii]|uniref:YbjN domain-containing protein n=1 Tax=Mycolicibacterium vanbaalenii TaxID=110539 RepID=UPI0021F39A9F|nr:YbjN domain-containing protein [Mycolicibacterium vanbaalenii]